MLNFKKCRIGWGVEVFEKVSPIGIYAYTQFDTRSITNAKQIPNPHWQHQLQQQQKRGGKK